MPKFRILPAAIAAIALSLLVVSPRAWADELGINLYGLSHHGNKEGFDHLHEFNPGAGLQWTFARSERASLETNLGIYSDSFAHANYHLSLAGRVRVAGPVDLGLQLINSVSESSDGGRPVVTPFPIVGVRTRWGTVNMAYTPEMKSINPTGLTAMYVTVYPKRWRHGGQAKVADDGIDTSFGGIEFTLDGINGVSGMSPYANGLSAGSEDGFLWRHMFDDRRGLRVGCLFGATVSWSQYDGYPKTGTYGSYSSNMLVQYLQRQSPRGRLRTYWATGLESHYRGGAIQDEIDNSWRTDLGVECDLGGGVSLLLEYGLLLNYKWRAREYYDDIINQREAWRFEPAGARLGVVAWRGNARAAAAVAASDSLVERRSGPLVTLGYGLQRVNTGTIGWQWSGGPTRAWRVVVGGQAGHDRQPASFDRDENTSEYRLSVGVQRLWRRPGARGVSTYWGAGPVVGYGVEYMHGIDYDGEPRDERSHEAYAGGALLVGADYPLGAGLSLMAEYGTAIRFHTTTEVHSWRHGWEIAPRDAVFGVTAGF